MSIGVSRLARRTHACWHACTVKIQIIQLFGSAHVIHPQSQIVLIHDSMVVNPHIGSIGKDMIVPIVVAIFKEIPQAGDGVNNCQWVPRRPRRAVRIIDIGLPHGIVLWAVSYQKAARIDVAAKFSPREDHGPLPIVNHVSSVRRAEEIEFVA